MDEMPIAEGDREMQELLSLFDGPAFMRRARKVKEALEHVIRRATQQRDEWLLMVRVHLGRLFGLAGKPENLLPLLAEDQVALLQTMYGALAPELRDPPAPVTSLRPLRRTLDELIESIDRFNARWQRYIEAIDLTEINETRAGYNRWYVLEKECAVRSPAVARQGFQPLPMCDTTELFALLPLLPVPRKREGSE